MAGDVSLGVWALLGEPRTAAALEHAGFDWVLLDQQHGHFDDRAVRETFEHRGTPRVPMLVRPRANAADLIGRALDDGADGVVVPLVDGADQAEAAVAATRYPPRGGRSYGPLPHLEPAPDAPAPFVGVMVETAAGLADVDAIARTPDLDLVLVGPFDLSLSLGTTVDELLADDAPDAPLRRVIAACRAAGVRAGAFGATEPRARRLVELGFDFVVAALDTSVLAAGGDIATRVRA
ncbi:HpcH/HpaI aldolase family protein [Amnibacterium endophyticum]|uniref:HpcH/HpaI aldolase/citrate lyase family protein n=1 Tax=Amnibacterium endophyticum TaxID=2109337 RepID=A0ABW4LDV3_9MICO